MLLIQLENGLPVNNPIKDSNFRMLFPNTSYPKVLTPEIVEGTGYGVYKQSEKPSAEKYKNVVEQTPVQDSDGYWVQTWSLVDMDTQEKADADAVQASIIRAARELKLQSSDWTQVSDAPVDASAWATYRQALRDITDHANFPYLEDADWPTKP